MKYPFYFIFEAEPTAAAQKAENVSSAVVKIFVMAPSLSEAQAKASSLLIDFAWVNKGLLFSLQLSAPPDERVSLMDRSTFELYQRALQFGQAVDFEAVVVDNRPGIENEILSLTPPSENKIKH